MSESTGFYRFVSTTIATAIAARRRHELLPLGTAESPGLTDSVSPPVVCIDLSQEKTATQPSGWEQLHDLIAADKPGNQKPWFRCIGVLKGHEAKTAVVETHYICLDYRSEFASFYAHLDAPRRSATVRVHFFSETIRQNQVTTLDHKQCDSYLGYIVCREGDLPLVGRSVLKKPSYIDVHSAIREPVDFFGQSLNVVGVPFMQQDARFAVCAHVAVWVLHYTAFRMNLTERRLIADLVTSNAQVLPLRPRAAAGLSSKAVITLLESVGLGCFAYRTPWIGMDLPRLNGEQFPAVQELMNQGRQTPNQQDEDVARVAEAAFRSYIKDHSSEDSDTQTPYGGLDQGCWEVRSVDALLDHLLTPYLESGWPVYAESGDHSLVLCGRSQGSSGPIYYVHDDQCGPYLATESLMLVSRRSLRYQSGLPLTMHSEAHQVEPLPPRDRTTDAKTDFNSLRGQDHLRAIHAFLVPYPPRAGLQPVYAELDALRLLKHLRAQYEDLNKSPSVELSGLSTAQRRVTLRLGTDYRRLRRLAASKPDSVGATDDAAHRIYSTLPLAEWVVVVEGFEPDGLVTWEFVYDASSSPDQPRLQFARLQDSVVVVGPSPSARFESEQIYRKTYPPLPSPNHSDEDWTSSELVESVLPGPRARPVAGGVPAAEGTVSAAMSEKPEQGKTLDPGVDGSGTISVDGSTGSGAMAHDD